MAEEWFYTNDGQQMGPVSIASLRELANKGGLQPSDLVWTEGMSTWMPANATRGLFPSPRPGAVAAPHVPEVKPSAPPRVVDDRPMIRLHERRFDRRPMPVGMSTGTKILIGLGIAGVVSLVLLVGFLMLVSIITEAADQARYQSQGGRNRQPVFGPPGQVVAPNGRPLNGPAIPPPAVLKVAPPGKKGYVVNLTAANPTEGHTIAFTKGQRVNIVVTATQFVPDEDNMIDVDLYVYDSRGVLVEFDDGPEKDCQLFFVPERTENYTVVVHLCSGASATCKVEY